MENMELKGRLSISLADDMIRPDLPDVVAAVDFDVALGRIRFVNFGEMLTKNVLEVEAETAAVVVVVGNLSNFDFLEILKKEKKNVFF